MTILVTGATGTVGRHVVDQLVKRGADVRALVRDPAKANLPAGVTTLKAGTRVEFGILSGRKGDQAHQVRVLEAPPSVSRAVARQQRRKPEEMAGITEDLIRLLDGVGEAYRHGRHPDAKTAKPTAKLLRALADELDL